MESLDMSTTLTGYEALSRPFRYVLEYYPDEQPELAALIGKPYTVRLTRKPETSKMPMISGRSCTMSVLPLQKISICTV